MKKFFLSFLLLAFVAFPAFADGDYFCKISKNIKERTRGGYLARDASLQFYLRSYFPGRQLGKIGYYGPLSKTARDSFCENLEKIKTESQREYYKKNPKKSKEEKCKERYFVKGPPTAGLFYFLI